MNEDKIYNEIDNILDNKKFKDPNTDFFEYLEFTHKIIDKFAELKKLGKNPIPTDLMFVEVIKKLENINDGKYGSKILIDKAIKELQIEKKKQRIEEVFE